METLYGESSIASKSFTSNDLAHMQKACLQVRQSCLVARHGLHCLRIAQHHDFSSAQVSVKSRSPLCLRRGLNDHMLLSFSDYSTERQKLAPSLTLPHLSLVDPLTPMQQPENQPTLAENDRNNQYLRIALFHSITAAKASCLDKKPK